MFILHKKLEELNARYSNRPVVLFRSEGGYKACTFTQFLNIAQKIGYFLLKEKSQEKENIALFLENQPHWGCVYLGILFAGCAAVPLDVKLTEEELENIFADASIKIIFTSKTLVSKINPNKNFKIFIVDELIDRLPAPVNINWPKVNLDDVCSLIYTSGTTAKPKAVMLTHRNFSSNINSIIETGLIVEKDNLLSMLPLHHTYPFMVNLLLPLFLGAKITYIESLASEDILRCIKEAKVTIVCAVPQFYSLLLNGIKAKFKKMPFPMQVFINVLSETFWLIRKSMRINLSKILFKKIHHNFSEDFRYFASGGAKLNPKDAVGLFKLGFTVLEGYGLTETSPVVSFNLPKKIKIGSVGKAVPGVELKTSNGEIIIKGENVFKGYYKREDLTRQVIKDGWFYSGDLGYIDKDGFIYISGRSKEMIVLASGKNIYPEELEEFYKQSPFIKEICLLEIEGNLRALIVPDMEHFKKTEISNIRETLSAQLDILSRRLSSFKRLSGFLISTEGLPRTRLGKLQRYKIKQIYESKIQTQEKKKIDRLTPVEKQTVLETGLSDRIIDFLIKELKMQVSPHDHLELDLGIDSLKRIELGLSLEKFLNLEPPGNILAEVFTVQELIDRLEEISKAQVSIFKKTGDLSWKGLLSQEPSLEIRKKIQLQPDFFNKVLTFFIARLFFLFFAAFFLLRVKGRNNLPKEGPYILCANHTSYLDALIVASSLPFKIQLDTFFLGHTNIFELPLFKSIVTLARVISIDPNIHLTDAMQAAAFVLRNGKIACIFPEGQRSLDGELTEFKNGIGILIKELNMPCVPVYIKGAFGAWPRFRRFPIPHPITITFAKAYTKEELKLMGAKISPANTDEYTLISAGAKEALIKITRHVSRYFQQISEVEI